MKAYQSDRYAFSIQLPLAWRNQPVDPESISVKSFIDGARGSLTIGELDTHDLQADGLTLGAYADLVLSVLAAEAFNFEIDARRQVSVQQLAAAELVEDDVDGAGSRPPRVAVDHVVDVLIVGVGVDGGH